MGFLIVIILVLALFAAIGFAAIYVGVMVMLTIIGAFCLLVFAVLYAVLGEQNVGWAIIMALPIGIGAAFMLINKEK